MTLPGIIQRFAHIVDDSPHRCAITGGEHTVTYAELASRAGGVAAALTAAGTRPGERVGLLTAHGTDTVAAILGTLAAGCAYVPLDPGFPAARLAHMSRTAGVSTFLAAPAHLPQAASLRGAQARPIIDTGALDTRDLDVPGYARLDETAYVLFTSGSTGTPKAIAQTARNLLHVTDNQIATLAVTPDDTLSLLASISFDAAIPDLYPALLSGASVLPIDLRARGAAHAVDALHAHSATILHSTPTVFRYLLEALDSHTASAGTLAAVRAVLLGGEQARFADLALGRDRFAPDCVFVNGYGCTEVTFAAQYRLPAIAVHDGSSGPVPIGTALPGYEVVLDGSGEIVVRGAYVLKGYADGTDARFGTGADGVAEYRTGDLGKRLPDGTLTCLGRVDRQVKVRGHRVEPAEVEAALEAQPGVARARVIARGDRLLGYVRATDGAPEPDPRTVRAALAGTLPGYCLPSAVVVVEEFPLTLTGKLDERALPEPATEPGPARQMGDTERLVHDMWCELLGLAAVGPAESFFDLGGHSLLLGSLRQRLSETFGVAIPLLRLFQHPTVAAQAALLDTPRVPAAAESPGVDRGTGRHEPGREPSDDDIAVVGLAGRFPGAADIDTFWWNLCAGADSMHDYTEDELAELGIGAGLRADPRHVRTAGRLADVEYFDAEFFSCTTQEARLTDPQHRIMLETAWEALETAGHDPAAEGLLTGVFTSCSANKYFLFHLFGNPDAAGEIDPDDWEARMLTGQASDHLPGQLAYRLGLTGPALAVQSACSSSLVAVCLAAQSLADYRCDLALAGGVSLTWPRYRHTEGGLAAPDGRCRAFDAAASGSGFGSGASAVVLRRLADARADRDHVYAILPGWGVSNDGPDRAGFTVPGPTGQAAAMTEALAAADLAPDSVRLVETHGSGTPLGDAIEAAALNDVYGGAGKAHETMLGAVKTNIGHLDAAAGVAGLAKAVLAVEHGVIPPNLHFTRANPEIDLTTGGFAVPTKPQDWPDAGLRRAAVSAFGLGGTNAHVIVEQAEMAEPAGQVMARPGYLLPISARGEAALRAAVSRLHDHLDAGGAELADVAFTLALGRRGFDCRAAVACRDHAEAVAALAELRDGEARVCGGPPELAALGQSWVDGADVDWAALHADKPGRRIALPTYPFQRRKFWIDPAKKQEVPR